MKVVEVVVVLLVVVVVVMVVGAVVGNCSLANVMVVVPFVVRAVTVNVVEGVLDIGLC